MNRNGRQARDRIVATFAMYSDEDNVKAADRGALDGILDCAKCELEELLAEEQDKFDNMPESLQCTSRGDAMQEVIDNLENAVSALEDAISLIPGKGEKGDEGWEADLAEKVEEADSAANGF